MSSDKFNIIGYHGTTDYYAALIEKDGFCVRISNRGLPNHWLGNGIYFFELPELAKYWGETKSTSINSKYGHNCKEVVLKADIQADNDLVFDLDNNRDVKKLSEYYQGFKAKTKDGKALKINFADGLNKAKMKETDYYGEIEKRERCFILDLMKREHNLAIIIRTFGKDNPGYMGCKAVLGIDYKEKQICVTDKKYITSYEQMKK